MTAPNPSQLAASVRKTLHAAGAAAVAARSRTYFKSGDPAKFYGVKSSRLREIEKESFDRVRGIWNLNDAVEFCDIMIRDDHLECKAVGFLLLGRHRREFPRGLLRRVRSWILGGFCSNWATLDGLASEVISPLILEYPGLVDRVVDWSGSRSLWLRRAAAVTFVKPVRKGRHLDPSYAVAERLLGDREDLVQKACGWLLREAGKADGVRLERFLMLHGPRVPRTTLRYAIERFPDQTRQRLLRSTRA